VQVLSEIRNNAVHNAKSFDLDLTKYVAELKQEQRRKWKKALSSWWVPFPDPQHEAAAQHEAAGRRVFESALQPKRKYIQFMHFYFIYGSGSGIERGVATEPSERAEEFFSSCA
jgi:hypothetical protein